jgi:HSP20 family protein
MTFTVWGPLEGSSEPSRRFQPAPSREALSSESAWVPAVNIYGDAGGDFRITVELPDVRREDIEITVENTTLVVRGEKKIDPAIRSESVQRLERSYGAFRRAFTLPRAVDAANVKAEYRDGVLTLKVPLREETKPRRISVSAAE